jgi:hypothetical protein
MTITTKPLRQHSTPRVEGAALLDHVATLRELGVEPGDIVETVFLPLFVEKVENVSDEIGWHVHMTGFSVDVRGQIRLAEGFVAYSDETESNPDYVPRNRFDVNTSPWNSHQPYLEINLPNPAVDAGQHQLIRTAFMREIARRLVALKATLDNQSNCDDQDSDQ